nr:hypothetical protein [Thiolapillus sp.]
MTNNSTPKSAVFCIRLRCCQQFLPLGIVLGGCRAIDPHASRRFHAKLNFVSSDADDNDTDVIADFHLIVHASLC